jgi:sarcosine/dimethylglycine N-methyltransferase
MTQENLRAVVDSTQSYYDGPADEIYRTIWADNIHLGVPPNADASHIEAMEHTNKLMAEMVDLRPGMRVVDLGCGYGSTARYLASNYGCHVTGTNISQKELSLARERAAGASLENLLSFEYGDFHDIPYAYGSFDVVWSQEAFLHAYDKRRVLSECKRVLTPGGTLIFTDILVRRDTPEADRARIYDRVKSPDMWDGEDYEGAINALGFEGQTTLDWSEYVARSYGWVLDRLEENREAIEPRAGKETVDNTLKALAFWVQSAQAGKIGWALFKASKPQAQPRTIQS